MTICNTRHLFLKLICYIRLLDGKSQTRVRKIRNSSPKILSLLYAYYASSFLSNHAICTRYMCNTCAMCIGVMYSSKCTGDFLIYPYFMSSFSPERSLCVFLWSFNSKDRKFLTNDHPFNFCDRVLKFMSL